MKATIAGFIGRNNFGDELMLWQHVAALRLAGFEHINITTAGATCEEMSALEKAGKCLGCAVRYGWNANDLFLIGGGALPPLFGVFEAAFAKERGAKVVYSSVDFSPGPLPAGQAFLAELADLVIVRTAQEVKHPRHVMLPDIGATVKVQRPKVPNPKTAVVIRHEQTIDMKELALDFPYDVVVLSAVDLEIAREHCDATGTGTLNYTSLDPVAQVKSLCQYSRVLSLGRLHAALVAAANGIPTVAIEWLEDYPRTWEELQARQTHTGKYAAIDLARRQPVTLDDYAAQIMSVMSR